MASPDSTERPSQDSEPMAIVSLEDYDGSQLLSTPRSLQACSRVGIDPRDLMVPTLRDTLAELRKAKEPTSDESIVKMRHAFRIQMQQRKLKAAVESYWLVCEEQALTPKPTSTTGVDSSKVLAEERQLRKIVETNKSRLRQQLLRMQLLQKQRQREDERLEVQRQADIQKRDELVRSMAERSKKEEEAAALRNQARDLEKTHMALVAEEARQRYETQNAELKSRMEERRRALDESNAAKREANRARRSRMKEQSESIIAQRRDELQSRMDAFEHEHISRLRQRDIEQARKRSEAEAREEKIQEAIRRSNAQLQAKVLMTEAKAAAVEQRLRDFALDRSEKRMANLADEMEKEAKRQEAYAQAVHVHQERVQQFVSRMAANDDRQKSLADDRQAQQRVTQELAKQRVLMKQDAVNRQRRVDERDRENLMKRVDHKVSRIADMQRREHDMKVQRKLHREEAERTRVKLTDVTPGPSDYVVTEGECGSNGPQWKLGLPASAAGPRVVLKCQPVPGYDCSPGPAAYSTGDVSESRHRTRSAFSFSKADRFSY